MKLSSVIVSENAVKFWYESADISPGGAFYASLRHQIKRSRWPWLEDIVAAESSVTVVFDLLQAEYRVVRNCINQQLEDVAVADFTEKPELLTLPVVYGGKIGMDLTDVARRCQLSKEEVINQHQKTIFTVTAVGFAPGFGYLKGLPEAICLPRRDNPRTNVPKGAVAIAENYTAIYPENSPGGWHLIGFCPEPLFDINLPVPALFRVGQQVKFVSVD